MQQQLTSFPPDAWKRVKEELRPELTEAIDGGDWGEVSRIWKNKKWMVEEAIQGKERKNGSN